MGSKVKKIDITKNNIKKYAGIEKYQFNSIEKKHTIGITTGLAWTEFGGEILKIETLLLEGKGKTISTGKLGEVMQESVQTAFSFVKSWSMNLGILNPLFEKKDLHI